MSKHLEANLEINVFIYIFIICICTVIPYHSIFRLIFELLYTHHLHLLPLNFRTQLYSMLFLINLPLILINLGVI